jgi:glucan-binding YG repeat protein
MGKPITLLNSRQYLKKNIMAISNIEKNGSWYYIYDEKGKKAKTLSVSAIGDIVDFSADFFVTKSGSWYYTYDENGKKIKTLSVSAIGEIISVTGNTFIAKSGSWLYTYDATGKKINTRPAK